MPDTSKIKKVISEAVDSALRAATEPRTPRATAQEAITNIKAELERGPIRGAIGEVLERQLALCESAESMYSALTEIAKVSGSVELEIVAHMARAALAEYQGQDVTSDPATTGTP